VSLIARALAGLSARAKSVPAPRDRPKPGGSPRTDHLAA